MGPAAGEPAPGSCDEGAQGTDDSTPAPGQESRVAGPYHVLMRFVRVAALPVFVGALLLFGWTYDVPGPPEPPLSDAEIGWVAAASGWLREPATERCAEPVAEPPSERLGGLAGDLRAACGADDRREAFDEAAAQLAGELRSRRELQEEGGLSARSRVEPVLGEAFTVLGGSRPVEVRCWTQADWRGVRAEESALAGAPPPATDWLFVPERRAIQLQGVHCGPLVRLALGEQPRGRGRRADLALALWTAAAAAESVSLRPCVPPARLALVLGAARPYAVALARFAWRELRPALPAPSRRCTTSRPS
jgi:hypothetical protein